MSCSVGDVAVGLRWRTSESMMDGGGRGMAPGRFGGGIKLLEAGGGLLGRVTMKKDQRALASTSAGKKRSR